MKCVLSFLFIQLAAFWPVWRWYLARVMDSSDEPWGLLALGTALVFLFVQGRNEAPKKRAMMLSASFTVLYAVTYYFFPPLLRAVFAVLALCCSVSTCCLGKSVHLGILGLFLLSLPLIASLQFYAGFPVRLLTSHLASQIISSTGFPVTPQGTSLFWAGEVVSVDAPCAGIRMLWSGLYLSFTLACFSGLSSMQTWLSYSVSMFTVFIGNVLRATVLFYVEAGIISSPTWAHQAIGLVVFAFVASIILIFNRAVKKAA